MLALLILTCCLNAPLEATVDSDAMTLGQIVPIPASDPRAAVALGYAPSPGLARRIQRQEIVARIQAAGLSLDDLEFPESILVRRRSASLNPEMVKEAIMAALVRQFPDASIDLLSVDMPAAQVGTGEVTMSAALPSHFDPKQPFFIRLDVRGGTSARTLFVRSAVRIETVQPVIRSHVAANTEIKADDIEWRPAVLEGTGTVPSSADAFNGMLAKRDLEPGQVARAELFYAPLYVRKGEPVTVKASSGAVTISATMRALAAGRLGDTIQVQHLSGNGTAIARVVGPRLLEAIQR